MAESCLGIGGMLEALCEYAKHPEGLSSHEICGYLETELDAQRAFSSKTKEHELLMAALNELLPRKGRPGDGLLSGGPLGAREVDLCAVAGSAAEVDQGGQHCRALRCRACCTPSTWRKASPNRPPARYRLRQMLNRNACSQPGNPVRRNGALCRSTVLRSLSVSVAYTSAALVAGHAHLLSRPVFQWWQ